MSEARTLGVVLAVLTLSILPARAGADDVPVVTGATNYNSQRKVAVGPNGTVAVAYVSPAGDGTPADGTPYDGTAVRVKVSDDDGAHWRQLPPLSRADSFRPAVAYDAEGTVHVAWAELAGEHRQVLYARWSGGPDWEARAQLSDTPGYSGYPALAVDSRAGLHVVWYGFDGSQYQIYYRTRPVAGSWSPTEQASRIVRDANAPAIAVAPDDSIHVAYYSYVDGSLDVQYMARPHPQAGRAETVPPAGRAGWSTPRRVNAEGVPSSQPSLVVHDDGIPAVAYTAGRGDSTWVAYSELRGARWTGARRISPVGVASSAPSLAALAGHSAAAVFETADGRVLGTAMAPAAGPATEPAIAPATGPAAEPATEPATGPATEPATGPAGTWSPPVTVASGGARWPSLAWATFPALPREDPASGLPHLVWTAESPAGYELGFRSATGWPRDRAEEEWTRSLALAAGIVLGGLVLIAARGRRVIG